MEGEPSFINSSVIVDECDKWTSFVSVEVPNLRRNEDRGGSSTGSFSRRSPDNDDGTLMKHANTTLCGHISNMPQYDLSDAASTNEDTESVAESVYTVKAKNGVHRYVYGNVDDLPRRRQTRRSSWHASSPTVAAMDDDESSIKKNKKKEKKLTKSRKVELCEGQSSGQDMTEDFPFLNDFSELDTLPRSSVRITKPSNLKSSNKTSKQSNDYALIVDLFKDPNDLVSGNEVNDMIEKAEEVDRRKVLMMKHKQQNVQAPSRMMRRSSWSGTGYLVPSSTSVGVTSLAPAEHVMFSPYHSASFSETDNAAEKDFKTESDCTDFVPPPPSFGRLSSWTVVTETNYEALNKLNELDTIRIKYEKDNPTGQRDVETSRTCSLTPSLFDTVKGDSLVLDVNGSRNTLFHTNGVYEKRKAPGRRQPRRSSWHSSSDPYVSANKSPLCHVMPLNKSRSNLSVFAIRPKINHNFAEESVGPNDVVTTRADRKSLLVSASADGDNGFLDDLNVSNQIGGTADSTDVQVIVDRTSGFFGRRQHRSISGGCSNELKAKPDDDTSKGHCRLSQPISITLKVPSSRDSKEEGKGIFRAFRRSSMGSERTLMLARVPHVARKAPSRSPPRRETDFLPMVVSRHDMPRIDSAGQFCREDGGGVDCIQLTDLGGVTTVTYAHATVEP